MKKSFVLSLLISLPLCVMATSVWSGSSSTWTSGSGTAESPYLIETPEQLAYLSATVAQGNSYEGVFFKQTDDFNMNSAHYSFSPIGKSLTQPFSGCYDGDGHSISMLKPSANNSSCALFGWAKSATIQNIIVDSITFIPTSAKTGSATYDNYVYDKVASIVGYIEDGRIINCTNNAEAIAYKATKVAGIVAEAQSSIIIGCSNNAIIYNGAVLNTTIADGELLDSYWGGIVAYCSTHDSISNCVNMNGIGSARFAGGIVGYISNINQESLIFNCENNGTCRSTSYFFGGIIGYAYTNIQINKCRNIGMIVNSYSNYHPTDNNIILHIVGGICGWANWNVNLSECANYATFQYSLSLPSYFHMGGLVGISAGPLTINNSQNNGSITLIGRDGVWPYTPKSYYNYMMVGGIIGKSAHTTYIENSFNTGTINCTAANNRDNMGNASLFIIPYVGGLVGKNEGTLTEIVKCYNIGNVQATSTGSHTNVKMYVGGLVGDDSGSSSVCKLSYTYTVADVKAPANTITILESHAAGLIGYANNSIVNNSYYAGSIEGINRKGIANGTLTSASGYYLSTCGASAGAGTAKTEAEMKSVAFLSELNAPGEQEFYQDNELINNGYPILSFQTSSVVTSLDNNSSAQTTDQLPRKILQNGQLCILLPNGICFDVTGKRVE